MASMRTARMIAAFEGGKGLLAIAAALSLLGELDPTVHGLAASLVSHTGWHAPALPAAAELLRPLMHSALDHAVFTLLLLAAYAALHLTEAYGLWRGRAWAAVLGAASGSLYIPLELQHVLRHPTVPGLMLVLINAAVVVLLLRHARATDPRLAGARPPERGPAPTGAAT